MNRRVEIGPQEWWFLTITDEAPEPYPEKGYYFDQIEVPDEIVARWRALVAEKKALDTYFQERLAQSEAEWKQKYPEQVKAHAERMRKAGLAF